MKGNVAFATEGSFCFDFFSATDYVLSPGETKIIGTGVFLEDGDLKKTQAIMVCSRSGMAAKAGVFVLNAPGIIDSDYRQEIGVILHNTNKNAFVINKGDKIAQGFVCNGGIAAFARQSSEKRNGGFGSTDKKE